MNWSVPVQAPSNSERFGHGSTKGLWFMKVNLVRDGYAVNNRETSEWDRWREASPQLRTVSTEELPQLDRLARYPESCQASLQPIGWPVSRA